MRVSRFVAGCLGAAFLSAGQVHAEDRCSLASRYDPENPSVPAHLVTFVFTGVNNEPVALSIDGTRVLDATLTTEDRSTEYSGGTSCVLAGRYAFEAKIGEASGLVHLDISETTTVYLSARDGVLAFNIWGPDAPGLD